MRGVRENSMTLSDFLVGHGIVVSKSEVRKLLACKHIKINGESQLGILDVEIYPSDTVTIGNVNYKVELKPKDQAK